MKKLRTAKCSVYSSWLILPKWQTIIKKSHERVKHSWIILTVTAPYGYQVVEGGVISAHAIITSHFINAICPLRPAIVMTCCTFVKICMAEGRDTHTHTHTHTRARVRTDTHTEIQVRIPSRAMGTFSPHNAPPAMHYLSDIRPEPARGLRSSCDGSAFEFVRTNYVQLLTALQMFSTMGEASHLCRFTWLLVDLTK